MNDLVPSQRLKKARVLLVEDDEGPRDLMEMALKDMGVGIVITAQDGKEAQEKLEELGSSYFNLMICDWNLPYVTGLELLTELRKKHDPLPFLMITGRGTIDSIVKAKDADVTAYLPKPFTPYQFVDKVKALIEV